MIIFYPLGNEVDIMFILLSGLSGSGKTTLINKILCFEKDYMYPCCVTTRSKRETDADSRYIYVSKEEFEKFICDDNLLEYQIYRDNYYGTLLKSYEEICNKGKMAITEMGYDGILKVKDRVINSINIYIDVDVDLIGMRMLDRGESYDFIKQRLRNIDKEKEQLLSISDYVLKNDSSIDDMYDGFKKIVERVRKQK